MKVNLKPTIRLAIETLINDESQINTKLSLLTEISVLTENKETFAICEKLRADLCAQEDEKAGGDLPPTRSKRTPKDGKAPKRSDENNGAE